MPASVDALIILLALMPGFLSQSIISSYSTYYPRSRLTYVLAALGLTLVDYTVLLALLAFWDVCTHSGQLLHTTALLFGEISASDASWSGIVLFVCVIAVISVAVGVIGAVIHERGWYYRLGSLLRITKKTGRPEVWLDVLLTYNARWLSIELQDGTSLVGFALYFSYPPERRELYLSGDKEGVEVKKPDGEVLIMDGVLVDWNQIRTLMVVPEEPSG